MPRGKLLGGSNLERLQTEFKNYFYQPTDSFQIYQLAAEAVGVGVGVGDEFKFGEHL